MILNVWTVTALFLAGVGALLAVATAVAGARALAAAAARDRELAIDRAHLLGLLVATLALVRALAWPHFYLLLESYVPALAPQGVMCAYGVTRVQPELATAVQWAKPLLLALLGAWFVLAAVDRRSDAATFARLRLLASVPLALLALGECALEAAWIASDKLEHEVSCCTQLADLAGGRVSQNVSPLALAGLDAPWKTFAAYFVLGSLVVAALRALARRPARPDARATGPRVGVALLAAAFLVVAQWAWLDAVAPRVLGLPYHHCLYEVVTRAPMMGVAAMATIFGGVAPWLAAALSFARGATPEATGTITDSVRLLERAAALALAASLLIVVVHIV
jgi:hypothetical protein